MPAHSSTAADARRDRGSRLNTLSRPRSRSKISRIRALRGFYDECVQRLLRPRRRRTRRRGAVRGRSALLRLVHASAQPSQRPCAGHGGAGHFRHVRLLDRGGVPITFGDDVLTVVPATLTKEPARAAALDRCACGDEARPQSAEGAPRVQRPDCRPARSMSSAAPWPARR